MATKHSKTKQRIKLKIEGSPVKLDGTLLSISPDARHIKVRFDADSLPDLDLYSWGNSGSKFMFDINIPEDRSPASYKNGELRIFEVL